MKINSFEVTGLLGRDGKVFAELNSDLNIITGRNGAGKTSLLKLLWYVISGNILLALKEVKFTSVTVNTDVYEITVHNIGKNSCRIDMVLGEKKYSFSDFEDPDGDFSNFAEDMAANHITEIGSSVFFPTFRRIEGGFSVDTARSQNFLVRGNSAKKSDIEEALSVLSRKLTNEAHTFVSAISTTDIVTLLLRQYADVSEQSSRIQQKVYTDVIQSIKEFNKNSTHSDQLANANSLISDIAEKIETMEGERGNIMSPINAVKAVVEGIFRHSGIKIGTRFSFGDAANGIQSEMLSAGEKQMLSFICYNAFFKNSPIFIDEPELSLHVDWQRKLFQTLMDQQSTNQFIIATHSPFIYSKYPDKEIVLDQDRGEG